MLASAWCATSHVSTAKAAVLACWVALLVTSSLVFAATYSESIREHLTLFPLGEWQALILALTVATLVAIGSWLWDEVRQSRPVS